MQSRPKAFAALLALVLLAQVTAFALFPHSPKTTRIAATNADFTIPINWHVVGWSHSTTTTTTVPPAPVPPPPKPQATQTKSVHTPTPNYAAGAGGFAACVRQHESGGNYTTNTGNGYHGAYQMTNSHWGGYGGYSSADQAPPAAQDAKFQSDVAQGSAYMHQQYPVTSRMCGM